MQEWIAGIPVIASDIDATREMIIPGETGILVPPKNPKALTAAIANMMKNKTKAIELGKQGNKWAREHFTSEKFIEDMSRIYREVTD